jgi:dipeptidyl aminopeptidase/acylaminoacyl peptidase
MKTDGRRAAGLLLLGVALLLATPSAQQRKPMTLLDIAELPRILDAQLSPDGRSVIYMLGQADWKADRLVWHLWRKDTQGGSPQQLTSGSNADVPGSARWAPDGASILFIRAGQIALIPPEGGEPRVLTHHATGVSSPAWSPGGALIYFLAADPTTPAELERERLKDDVYGVDENVKPRRLWSVALTTGDEQVLTPADQSVLSFRVSRDGTRLVSARAPSTLPDVAHRSEVWLMDANGGNARALTSNQVEESLPEISPDNSQVLFLADANGSLEPYYNTNIFIVPAAGGPPRLLLPDFPYEVNQANWSPDGRSIFAVVNMGVHSEIFQVDVATRAATELTDGAHYIPPTWSIVPSAGQMVFQFDEPTRFGDAWTLQIPTGRGGARAVPSRVTGVFDTFDRDFALPRQEKITWKGADGATVEGLLFYPIGYVAGTRYPLVVQLHGGPAESDKFGAGAGLLLSYFPVLAARGYAVLRPNYRGSSGYGNTAYRDVVGGYFNNMQLDVVAGVDALIARGIADPDQLALMGWSAGGHLTNKLITITSRFKAASAGASASDWISLYAQSDLREERAVWFGGMPWQKNALTTLFWNQSPVKDASHVTTPTLFFAGENDSRVPPEQSIEMYRALEGNGVPTHLYIAPREGHQWGELRHMLFKANTELAWFDRYVRGRSYTPEKIPSDGVSAP